MWNGNKTNTCNCTKLYQFLTEFEQILCWGTETQSAEGLNTGYAPNCPLSVSLQPISIRFRSVDRRNLCNQLHKFANWMCSFVTFFQCPRKCLKIVTGGRINVVVWLQLWQQHQQNVKQLEHPAVGSTKPSSLYNKVEGKVWGISQTDGPPFRAVVTFSAAAAPILLIPPEFSSL